MQLPRENNKVKKKKMVPLLLLSCCCYSHHLAIVSKFCFRLLLLRPHTVTHQQVDESGVEEKEKRLAFFLSFLAGSFGLQNCSVEVGIECCLMSFSLFIFICSVTSVFAVSFCCLFCYRSPSSS
jgi:hypothetical protein